jgi:hypothetical protein
MVRAVWTLVIVAASAACSSAPPAPTPSSTVGPPANAVVDGLIVGNAHVAVSGDVDQTYDWELLGASDAPDVTVITWGNGLDTFDLLALPGGMVEGEQASSLDLWTELHLISDHEQFLSEAGECSIKLTRVEPGHLRGRVECDQLTSESGDSSIALSVRFSAGPRGG